MAPPSRFNFALARVAIFVLLAGLTIFSVAGCQKAAATAPAKAPPPPTVFFTLPVSKPVQEFEEFTGRTWSVSSVEVRARVSGYLEKVEFDDGATVAEGDLLFEIDRRTYAAELAKATAAVEQAQARLERLGKQVARAQELFSKKVMSEEDYELRTFDRTEAQAALAAAVAARDLAQLNVDFTSIRAPSSGKISRRLVDPGNLVRADETPLATIVSHDPIHVYFDIDERTVLRIRRLIQEGRIMDPRDAQLDVFVSLADEKEYVRKGTVDFEDNHIDPSTGTLRVRILVENKDGLLSPGLFVRLRFPVGEARPALLVPEESLASDQGRRFVYVIGEENKVAPRPVEIGILVEGQRVIEKGLEPTDRVVVTGLQRLKKNMPVDPRPVSSEKDAATGG